jgi:hypothetical protein
MKKKKENKMLPFIAGVAAGAVAVVAVNNNKKIKKQVIKSAEKVKEVAKDVKKTVEEKVDCLTSKKETTKKIEAKDDK